MIEGDDDAVGTMASWIATARDHGEEFTEDDWIARFVADGDRQNRHDGAVTKCTRTLGQHWGHVSLRARLS